MDQSVSKKLKSFDTMRWLKNRFKNQVKDKYILNDQELKEQIMMKAVFKSIDRDKSKFLDRSELYDMFRKYGIKITKQKLKEFFKRIDQDEDDKLNWSDFKQALQNQEALAMFVELMRKIRDTDDSNSLNFIPLSFPNMIQYMNYCVLREELIQGIESDTLNAAQKIRQCRNLLTLEELCYRNIQKVDKEDEEQDIAEQSKKSDHQQIAKMKRIQEKEMFQMRQSRARKLSNSQYYKSTDSTKVQSVTSRQYQQGQKLQENLHNSIDKTGLQYGKLIQSLTQDETPYKPVFRQQQSIMEIPSDSDYVYSKPKTTKRDAIIQQDLPKGSHFINQVFLNTRNPAKIRERLMHSSPRKRVMSQFESFKSKQNSMQ